MMLTVRVSSRSSLQASALASLVSSLGYYVHTDTTAPAHLIIQDLFNQKPPYPPPAEVPTLALVQADEPMILDLLRLGYRGYLLPEQDKNVLERALQALLQGELWVERHILEHLLSEPVERSFTPREEQVLGLLVQGYPNKKIAQRLGISVSTVKVHISSLLAKHRVKNRMHLILGNHRASVPDGVSDRPTRRTPSPVRARYMVHSRMLKGE